MATNGHDDTAGNSGSGGSSGGRGAPSDRELLESIAKKIADSKALNGGFDRLVVMVEGIQDKQEEAGRKLDKVTDAIYDPDNGIYSRIRCLENKLEAEKIIIAEVLENISDSELAELKVFRHNVEAAAGPQLEELNALVRIRKNLTKSYWILLTSVVAFLSNLLFQLFK